MPGPRIAVTMGDPAGIGPEIILKATAQLLPRIEAGELEMLVIGCGKTYQRTAVALALPSSEIEYVSAEHAAPWPRLGFIEAGPASVDIAPGVVSAEAGRLAYSAIDIAVRLALAGQAYAICTAPLNKEALNLAGHHFSGHTELLAELTGARDSVMMLAHGNMRVSHVSTHTALSNVPARVTPERVRRVIELTDEALRRLGVAAPRIAVAALNPHAGEGGLFGREDIEVTMPTLAALKAEGHDVHGPIPGDTVFVKLRAGQYDAVVAMYHDQGHVALKTIGFDRAVNVTIGLPIVRTSVAHGTAFDIAGRGLAETSSLIEAVRVASRIVAGQRRLGITGSQPVRPGSVPASV